MKPKRLTKQELIAVLRDLTESIAADDSFEGSLEFTCMDPGCAVGEFMVQASYRIGNSEGQGGMRIVGE